MEFIIFLFALSLASAEKSSIQEFTTANNLFALDAYKQVAIFETDNFLVSFFSAETVLALAQSGAKGESAEELRTVLHLPNDKRKIEKAVKNLLPKLRRSDSFTLHTANKIYVKKTFSIKDGFKHVARTVYHADIEPIDFSKREEAVNTINSWVEKQTNQKIKNLVTVDSLDKDTIAILVNALYLKMNWSSPFWPSSTSKADFYKTPTRIVKVDTLHHYGVNFNYYECPHLRAQFLELPFKGGDGSLVVVLPNENDGLSRLENSLQQVFEPPHQLKSKYLNVALPKFKLETHIDFKRILENLGVKKVFNATLADFSGIAGKKDALFISQVVQKTFIDVSEEGVEAAAATDVVMAIPTSARVQEPKFFNADHPFIFYVKVKKLILFAGRVVDPSKS